MNARLSIPSVDGGDFDGYLYAGPGGAAPGIVMLPEIYGVNRFLHETAERFAARGYAVLALDIFWRLARNVDLRYEGPEKKQANAYHDAFSYDLGVKDIQSAIGVLRERPECTGWVGVSGYCLGGTLAYLAAARTDADVAAAYYGTRIHDFLADAATVRKPLILHFGEQDHNTPPEVLARIDAAIEPNELIESFVYAGAKHAFANHIRPDRYHPAAAALADERTFAFLERAFSRAVRTGRPLR